MSASMVTTERAEQGAPAHALPRAWWGRKSDAGLTTTMMAILFPAFLALIFLTVQAGLYYHARQWSAAAADRAVARAAEVGASDADGVAEAVSFLADSFCASDGIAVESDPESGTVSATVVCQVPGPLSPWPAEATSTAPLERFIPETERG